MLDIGANAVINSSSTSQDVTKGSIGIFTEGGNVTFNNATITTSNGGIAGFYAKQLSPTNTLNTNTTATTLKGNVNINNFKIGLLSDNGVLNVNGNVSYDGPGFALLTKNNGSIKFANNSTLTLKGTSYGFTINQNLIDAENKKAIDFNGATINVESSNVTVFNVIAKNGDTFSTKNEGTSNLPGTKDLEKYVGKFKLHNTVASYKIASIDGGTINFNGSADENLKFLKTYKFQGNTVNVSSAINMELNNNDANTYFNSEVVGIALNSSPNLTKNTLSKDTRALTSLNISSSISANRLEQAPMIEGLNQNKSTIGAYIDYGVLNLKNGATINVEQQSTSNKGTDIVNNNSIGIYAKDGSKIVTESGATINVYGEDGAGIYALASNTNKYGFSPVATDIQNSGNINVYGNNGVGIYADSVDSLKGTLVNSGDIKVGNNEGGDSNIGIFTDNNTVTNTGNIDVNSSNPASNNTSVGIYALNSDVHIGSSTFGLGEKSIGIIIKDGSTLDTNIPSKENNNVTLTFKDLNAPKDTAINKIDAISKNGIIYDNGNTTKNTLGFNVDISDVTSGKAIIAKDTNLDVEKNSNITISGVNGKGIKIANGVLNNAGTITINKETSNFTDKIFSPSIGIVASNKSSTVNNTGVININSTGGVGIYIKNEKDSKNVLSNIGNINLNGKNSIGVMLKNTNFTFDKNAHLNFNNSQISKGILALNGSQVTINNDFNTSVSAGSLLATGVGKNTTLIDNSNLTLDKSDAVGFYIKHGAQYRKDDNNSILTVKDGAVGIYSSLGATNITNANINLATTTITNSPAIGMLLEGYDLAQNKNVSGNVKFSGNQNDIGIVAKTSNLYLNNGLTLNYSNGTGTGVYLDNSSILGDSTINISGNSNGSKSTIGVYVDSNKTYKSKIENLTTNINKDYTIGTYLKNGELTAKEQINIGTIGNTLLNNCLGLIASIGTKLNFMGNIELINAKNSAGIVSNGATITNNGIINTTNENIGIILNENSSYDGTNGSIKIKNNGSESIGIGIYTTGENISISNTGKFDLDKNNIAVYSDGSSIDTDIDILDENDLNKNQQTVAIVAKSKNNKESIIGGKTANDKMNLKLSKNSIGIVALDNYVKLQNLDIDMKLNNTNTSNRGYGIILGGKDIKDNKHYLENINISTFEGIGIALNSSGVIQSYISNSTFNLNSLENDDYKSIGIVGQFGDSLNLTNNTFNLNSSYGIYGNSSIITLESSSLNLSGNSTGIFSDGSGSISLDKNTNITLAKGLNGSLITMKDGMLINNANITSDNYLGTFSGIIATGWSSTVKNFGNISLTGDKVFGIVNTKTGEIINNGNITISTNTPYNPEVGFSYALYSNAGSVTNTGAINLGKSSVGIAYTGNGSNSTITSNTINMTGENNIGVLLSTDKKNSSLKNINIDSVASNSDENVGVYVNNYTLPNLTVKNIDLQNHSSGIYIKNSSIGKLDIDNLNVKNNSLGLTFLNSNTKDNITLDKMTVGNSSVGFYLDNSNIKLNYDNINDTLKGNGSILFSLKNNSNLNMTTNSKNLTIDNNIGVLLENGSTISSNNTLENITVLNGGTGIVVKGNDNKYDSLIGENTNIIVGNGSAENEKLSVGAYFKDVNDFKNGKKLNITFGTSKFKKTEYALGASLNDTFGTVNTTLDLHSNVENSIGLMAIGKNSIPDGYNVLNLVATDNKKELININGKYNFGIYAQDIDMTTTGDINVSSKKRLTSMGISLSSKNANNTYTGNGNIYLTGTNSGIHAIGYNIEQTGNITIKGAQSIGIVNLNKEYENKNIDFKGNISIDGLLSTGIFSYGSNITTSNGNLDIVGGKTNSLLGNSIGIFSKENGNLDINFDHITINGKNSIGIYKEITESYGIYNTMDIGKGTFDILGRNFGIMSKNTTESYISLNNNADFKIDKRAVGIYTIGRVELNNTGNFTVGDRSRGIYMAVSNYLDIANGKNSGTINITGNAGVGIQASGYVNFENDGILNILNNGSSVGAYATSGATISNNEKGIINVSGKNSSGMLAKFTNTTDSNVINYGTINVSEYGSGMVALGNTAWAINSGTINVLNNGTGMIASGENSHAINEGTINLNKNVVFTNSLVGMGAFDGGTILNDTTGNINVDGGVGMFFDTKSKFENKGTITIKNGTGILGPGATINNGGKIIITGSGHAIGDIKDSDLIASFKPTFGQQKEGSIVIDTEKNLAVINNNFKNIGGVIDSNLDIVLKDPVVDITKGSLGINAPVITGTIKLDSNFALTGNGIKYEYEDFLLPHSNVNINASPLYKVEINDTDVTLNKIKYKDLTFGNNFDIRDDALDDILSKGGVDAEKLKEINSYLVGLDASQVHSELDRIASGIGGNVYSNIQDRITDIDRVFKNSFEDMYYSKNLSSKNDKYHIITTSGKRRYKDTLSPSYDYHMIGLNYMKEWEKMNRKYGYDGGLLVSKFKFKNTPSKEDVYSINGGIYNYSSLPYNFGFFTRLAGGVNYHRLRNIVDFGNNSVKNRGNYVSYMGSLENTLDFNFINNANSKLGIFTGSELQYSIFDTIKEKGELALKVKSNDYFSNKVIAGVKGNSLTQLSDNWYLKLRGDVKVSHEFENLKANKAKFKGINSQEWALLHSRTSKDTVSLKGIIGLSKNKTFDVDFSSEIIQDFKKDNKYWNVGLTFTVRFNDNKDLINSITSTK